MDTATEFTRGMSVWVLDPNTLGPSDRFPGEWKVDVTPQRASQRSVKLTQGEAPNVRRLNCDKSLIATTAPEGGVAVTDVRFPWPQGALVHWPAAPPKASGFVFIVIDDKGERTVGRLVLLGGDGGRYWRKVPAAQLTEVSPVRALQILGVETPVL